MMDHTGIAQIMYEPPKSDGSTCTLMAASLRLDVKHNLDEQELYSELELMQPPLFLFFWNFLEVIWKWSIFFKLICETQECPLPPLFYCSWRALWPDDKGRVQRDRQPQLELAGWHLSSLNGSKVFCCVLPHLLWMIQGDFFALTPLKKSPFINTSYIYHMNMLTWILLIIKAFNGKLDCRNIRFILSFVFDNKHDSTFKALCPFFLE